MNYSQRLFLTHLAASGFLLYHPTGLRSYDSVRKADFELLLRYKGQRLPQGHKVELELLQHSFRFGVNLHMFGVVEKEMQDFILSSVNDCFNAVTLPFYWGKSLYRDLPAYEPVQNQVRKDGTLKPAFQRIKRLISGEWHSKTMQTVDGNGIVAANGCK